MKNSIKSFTKSVKSGRKSAKSFTRSVKSTRKSANSAQKSTKFTKKSVSTSSAPRPATDFNRHALEKTLKIDAKALGIPAGAADVFIAKTLDAVDQAFKQHKIVTRRDFEATVVKSLKTFHKDFAYIYQNRDKIV